MKQSKEKFPLGFTALGILGLFFALILVLILDGARLFASDETKTVQAEFLLEEMDAPTAEVLLSETHLAPQGGDACRILEIHEVQPQKRLYTQKNGHILLLPSKDRFCVRVVLALPGKMSEDGFLAFGSLPMRPGARFGLKGTQMMSEGLLLSLSPSDAPIP